MEWEYRTICVLAQDFHSGKLDPAKLDEMLNGFGTEHWELVTTMNTTGSEGQIYRVYLTFKRPVRK